MAGKLVTIATFELPAKARLAQNVLETAGIKSTVADEAIVSMDWLIGNAIGWVKVQVLEEDAERAVAVLEDTLGKDEPVDEEELAAEAEAAAPEEGVAPPEPAVPDEAPETPMSERDEYARRVWLAAVFSLVFPLLWFYLVYLFLNAAFGEGSLSKSGKTKLFAVGGPLFLFVLFVVLPMFLFIVVFLIWLVGNLFG